MAVFDFSVEKETTAKTVKQTVTTYHVLESAESIATPEHPIMVLAQQKEPLLHHQTGSFMKPEERTAFEFKRDGDILHADVVEIDARFVRLLHYLGEKRMSLRLSGRQTEAGYAVYKIHAVDPFGRAAGYSAADGFLQHTISRLLSGRISTEDVDEEEEDAEAEKIHLTDIGSMADFLECAGDILPRNIRSWCYRNVALIKSSSISTDEKHHAQRALSMMLGIQWKNTYFESIDPIEARRILDEELYGLNSVKQRIIETIIQINRTHTLPAYGLLLVGPAGTGKSQLAYAVARILRLPWTSLDMSAIHDSEALTGSPRIYTNAKPGRIMEAFSRADSSNLVFIINELDKADNNNMNGNPADALLTLLDNIGYMDNYIECRIPTDGVYPIATANELERISAPLLSRFAVIELPDYTAEEKKVIFSRFSLPRVLARMGMEPRECVVTDEAVAVVVEKYADKSGCRDLEQAAEHLAANALYRIESQHVDSVVFTAQMTRALLEA